MEGLGRHKVYLEVREKGDLVGWSYWDVQNRDNLGDKQELRGNGDGDSTQDSSQGVWAGVLEGRDHLGAVSQDGLGSRYKAMGAGKIWELCHGKNWDPGILWVQEGLCPVPTIIKRSLPFFTWIAEPWPWRWTTAGCKGEHRD